jgi:hypothetical protein
MSGEGPSQGDSNTPGGRKDKGYGYIPPLSPNSHSLKKAKLKHDAKELWQEEKALLGLKAGTPAMDTTTKEQDRVISQKPPAQMSTRTKKARFQWALKSHVYPSPFYLSEDVNDSQKQLPVVADLLANVEDSTFNHMWDSNKGVEDNVESILVAIGGVLEESARSMCQQPAASSQQPAAISSSSIQPPPVVSNPFRQYLRWELGPTAAKSQACMFISGARMREAEAAFGLSYFEASSTSSSNSRRDSNSYVKVQLAQHKTARRPISEYAHRMVLWSIHGPPPLVGEHMIPWHEAMCMHTCSNQDCLNPSHLIWGRALENRNGNEMMVVQLRAQQHRVDMG